MHYRMALSCEKCFIKIYHLNYSETAKILTYTIFMETYVYQISDIYRIQKWVKILMLKNLKLTKTYENKNIFVVELDSSIIKYYNLVLNFNHIHQK